MMPPMTKLAFDERVDIDELLGDRPEARARYEQRRAIAALGRRIRQARDAVNLTQLALADRIGTTQPHLSEIERGTGPQGPTYGLLLKIAAACGTTAQALVAEPEEDAAAMDRWIKAGMRRLEAALKEGGVTFSAAEFFPTDEA